jgi:hypothetical protein
MVILSMGHLDNINYLTDRDYVIQAQNKKFYFIENSQY